MRYIEVLENCLGRKAEKNMLPLQLGDVPDTYASLYGLPTTGLRFFTVYGPYGRPDMALFLFTKAILAGEPIDVFNYGNHRRDFTYVDDISEGVIRSLDKVATPDEQWDSNHPDPATSRAPYRL
jgi:UDP-glucuronate 4-epimerase